MSHSKCRICQTDMHPRDGYRECPSCLGMQHLLDDTEKPCAVAVGLTLQERVQRVRHSTGNRKEVASKTPLVEEYTCKRKRDCTLDSSTRSSCSDIPQNKRGRVTVVQEPKDDTQSQILTALRDLAGKFGTCTTA